MPTHHSTWTPIGSAALGVLKKINRRGPKGASTAPAVLPRHEDGGSIEGGEGTDTVRAPPSCRRREEVAPGEPQKVP